MRQIILDMSRTEIELPQLRDRKIRQQGEYKKRLSVILNLPLIDMWVLAKRRAAFPEDGSTDIHISVISTFPYLIYFRGSTK